MARTNLRTRLLMNPRILGAAQSARDAVVWLSAPNGVVREWRRIDGDRTLRLEYDLDTDAVVLDVGGFEGQWASDVVAMYGCRIEVFEPVPTFAERIERRFARNPLVTVHAAGLAPADGSVRLGVSGDRSSHTHDEIAASGTVEVALRSVDAVFETLPERGVELMKINIEGAEYELLEHMVRSGLIERVRDLQVQFHAFVPEAEQRVDALRAALARTHRPTYQYDFMWENWRRS